MLDLKPVDHELFNHIRLRLVQRNPTVSWAEIAVELGFGNDDVNELVAWFLAYRSPPSPQIMLREGRLPRDPELRAQVLRLRRREESLVTVASEAPAQLAKVQRQLKSLERTH